jgi:hypothetical protein
MQNHPPPLQPKSNNPPLSQIAFCPSDSSLLSAVGDGFLKLYRATETALKQLPTSLGKRDPQSYPCHAWLVDGGEKQEKERCVVASTSGEVLLVEGGEVRATRLLCTLS